MHNAPPVVYPVGRFAWGIACVWVLVLMGALGLLCWQFLSQAVGALTWWAWSLWLVSSALAIWMMPNTAVIWYGPMVFGIGVMNSAKRVRCD